MSLAQLITSLAVIAAFAAIGLAVEVIGRRRGWKQLQRWDD